MNAMNVVLQTVFVAVCAVIVLFYMEMLPMVIRKTMAVIHGKPGCAPVKDLGNVTLHYFTGRGRGEAIRLIMEYADIQYTQTAFTKDSWPTSKRIGTESKLYTFGQVPAIETTSGIRLAQSLAIMHYIGRATGMDCDCEDMHLCEVIALGTEDAKMKLSRMLYDPNFKMADREVYLKETMPLWLGYFEALAPPLSKQEKAFFASDRLTWVDFVVFDLIEINREFAAYDFGQTKRLNVDVLQTFPKLNNFFRHLAGHPRISRYIHSKRRSAYTVPHLPVDSPVSRTA